MKIEIPTHCPICNSELELVNDQLFCRSTTCPAKSLKSLMHYTKTVKIMGLGERTLEKLEASNINDLYSYTSEDLITKLGEKIGTKLYNEIQGSTKTTITKFLHGMGIPLIGKTAAEKVDTVVNSIDEISEEVCKKAGLGAKATDNLMTWVNNEYDKYRDLPIEFEEYEPIESGLAVCVSGKIPGYTKAKLSEMLLDYGVHTRDSVTKDLDYLISNENGTIKVNKAKSYNIPVKTFSEFMEIIK